MTQIGADFEFSIECKEAAQSVSQSRNGPFEYAAAAVSLLMPLFPFRESENGNNNAPI